MHWITAPDNLGTACLHRFQQRRQTGTNLVRAHARDQRQLTWHIVRVQRFDQPNEFIRIEARPALQTNGVANTTHIFDMRPVGLPGPVTNPDHMRRSGIPVLLVGDGVAACQRFLIVEKKRHMAGVEICLGKWARCFRRDAAGPHEIEALLDTAGQFLKPFRLGCSGKEFGDPAVNFCEVGKAALREGAQQVQRGGRLFIDAQQPLWIRHPILFGKRHGVDHVTAIAWQLDAVDGFHRRGARLGKLACHPPDLDHRHRGTKGQHHCHLQNDLEGVTNIVRREFGKALGTVTTLKKEGPPFGNLAKLALQALRLACKHQRRHRGELRLDAGEFFGIRVIRNLFDGMVAPTVRLPGHGTSFLHVALEAGRHH